VTAAARPRTSPRRRRVLVAVSSALAALVLGAGPAAAHAELHDTVPTSDARRLGPVDEVRLRFNEPVQVATDGVRVLDEDGRLVSGPAAAVDHDVVAPVEASSDGWYVVSWRVVSADGHPVSGAFTFEVGISQRDAPTAVAAPGVPLGSALGWRLGRLGVALGAMLVVGSAFVQALAAVPLAGIRRIGVVGSAVLATSALVSGLAAGPYLLGAGWGDTTAPGVLPAALQLIAGAAAAVLWWAGPDRLSLLLAGACGAGALAASALVGHAATRSGVAQASLVVHLWAAGVWLGAVPALLMTVVAGHAGRWLVLARFSWFATWTLPVVVVAGVATTWQLAGSLADLRTAWGYALWAKVVLVAVAAGVGSYNRWAVLPGRRSAIRTTLVVEAVVLLAVLGATGIVTRYSAPAVGANDGPPTVAERIVFTSDLERDAGHFELVVDPPFDDRRVVHLSLWDHAEVPLEVEGAEILLSSEELDVEPLRVPLDRFGPAHFLGPVEGVVLEGRWQIDVRVRLDRFTLSSHRFEFDI
jgi:copper transport protein